MGKNDDVPFCWRCAGGRQLSLIPAASANVLVRGESPVEGGACVCVVANFPRISCGRAPPVNIRTLPNAPLVLRRCLCLCLWMFAATVSCTLLLTCASLCVVLLFDSVGNGTYEFQDLELVYSGPGQYQVVVVADSIQSPVSTGVITLRLEGAATTWDKIQSYLIMAGLFLLVSFESLRIPSCTLAHTTRSATVVCPAALLTLTPCLRIVCALHPRLA
jgi:hypothetical protein